MKKGTIFGVIVAALLVASTISWASLTYFGPLDMFYLRHFNHLFAVVGFVFYFFQFVLSAKIQWVEKGFGLDRMLRLHRTFGRLALGFLSLHFLALLVFEMVEFSRFYLFLFRWIGLIALIGLFITALVAVQYKKWNIPYETWKNIHRANYVIFPFALLHVFHNAAPGSFLYYLWIAFTVAFAAILAHKLIRFFQVRRRPYEVVQVKQENSEVWSLTFQGPSLEYKPGQFLHIKLLRNGKLSSSHPFTLSSSPTWENLAITPKELGDFTRTIKNTKPGDRAFIDAPYGVFSFLNTSGQDLVFIAGGIGITPFMSMLRYMNDKKLQKNVTLFWGNKSEKDLLFTEELKSFKNNLENLTLVYVMSRQKDWAGEKGRVNGKLIQKYVPDLQAPDFFICGPPAMSKAVIQDLKRLGVKTHRIHHELFDFID